MSEIYKNGDFGVISVEEIREVFSTKNLAVQSLS